MSDTSCEASRPAGSVDTAAIESAGARVEKVMQSPVPVLFQRASRRLGGAAGIAVKGQPGIPAGLLNDAIKKRHDLVQYLLRSRAMGGLEVAEDEDRYRYR